MFSMLKKLWNDRSGNALIITAASFPVLIGMAGLATDTIQWTLWKRELQRAADSAAIAGVYTRTKTNTLTAVKAAVCADIARTTSQTDRTMADLINTCPTPTMPADVGSTRNQVGVTLQVQRPLTFSSFWMSSAPVIQASARAAGFVETGTEYCVIALEPTGIGLDITGSTDVGMGDCSLISNSTNATRAASNGTNQAVSNGNNSRFTAKALNAVGFVQYNTHWNVQSYNPGSTAMPDPFAGKDAPTTCTKERTVAQLGTNRTGAAYTIPGTQTTIAAGAEFDTASDIVCITDSMALAGQTKIQLGPASYVFKGGSLGMSSANAYLGCNGCTLVMTGSTATSTTVGNINITGGTLAIKAPTSSTRTGATNYTGIAILQDPQASATTTGFDSYIQGNNGYNVQGAIYMPTRGLKFSGGSTSVTSCVQLVTRRIVFTGNSRMQVAANCPNMGLNALTSTDGGVKVRLVA